MKDTRSETSSQSDCQDRAGKKKPYTEPKLTVYGSVQEITGMGFAGSVADGQSGRARPG